MRKSYIPSIMNINIRQEILDFFTESYQTEAEIVCQTIQENIHTIHGCGSSFMDFARYCKEKILKHYENNRLEKLYKITFKKENQGYDNWNITPVFHFQ